MKMKNEEAIHALDTLVEAYGVAIRALRAQNSPAKLDRSRWEGCERCNWNWNLEGLEAWMRGELGEIRIIGDVMPCGVSSAQTVEQIKYCPFCGRPLTEEAWAEMERRRKHD